MNNKKISKYKKYPSCKVHRKKYNKKYYFKSRKNAFNSKKLLTKKELKLIWKHNIKDNELSKLLGRSIEAIQIARSKIKHKQYHL